MRSDKYHDNWSWIKPKIKIKIKEGHKTGMSSNINSEKCIKNAAFVLSNWKIL